MFSVPLYLLKTSAKFARILEQVKTLDCVSLISSRILPNVRHVFHQAMKARKTSFIS